MTERKTLSPHQQTTGARTVDARRRHRRPGHAGWDSRKKIDGRKRHIVVDTLGLPVATLVTTVSTQDRVAARSLLHRMRSTTGKRTTLV
ncbi:transposase [Saccharothrix coeruleofusca]|uniref:transposase n=1 Tax=Saccharothrix coeruleofusca TaxID=33919 RepID=UPI0035567877